MLIVYLKTAIRVSHVKKQNFQIEVADLKSALPIMTRLKTGYKTIAIFVFWIFNINLSQIGYVEFDGTSLRTLINMSHIFSMDAQLFETFRNINQIWGPILQNSLIEILRYINFLVIFWLDYATFK